VERWCLGGNPATGCPRHGLRCDVVSASSTAILQRDQNTDEQRKSSEFEIIYFSSSITNETPFKRPHLKVNLKSLQLKISLSKFP